jgi:CRP-like cAMP-binding protein
MMTSGMSDDAPQPAGHGFASHHGNRLLGALPAADLAMVLPHLERVSLPSRRVLFEPGDDVTHAYFPAPGTVLALVGAMADGRTTELALVGCEGALGGLISAGRKPAFARAVAQIGGSALRLESARLEEAKAASPRLRDLIHRFTDAMLAQVLQSVACSALHAVEERACRRLLEIRDRSGSDELPITQEHFAELLGVQRTTVTRVMADLVSSGAIEARRGRIIVANRARLLRGACECHEVVRRHFDCVAPGLYPDEEVAAT